jgi:hypothetical protein
MLWDGSFVLIPLSDADMLSWQSCEIESIKNPHPSPERWSEATYIENVMFEKSEEVGNYFHTEAACMPEMTYLDCGSDSDSKT